LDRKTL